MSVGGWHNKPLSVITNHEASLRNQRGFLVARRPSCVALNQPVFGGDAVFL
jgi:hypothetical protein